MPLVPVVTEIMIAQMLYLQWIDAKEPIFIYINSTGTIRDDGETAALEIESFVIYDAMKHIKNEIETVAVGAAIGHASLILAEETNGRRFAMAHAQTIDLTTSSSIYRPNASKR
ncbi:ATP-dependent Clp protease proteolytic subunit-related protein 3, chloroplastic-like [Zingiber officinale]|uniref:ATP-dependent Clp protease proteolytic subunit-related protein 3, chloroplastic-like n=1 Tax=Zingiber officinale TaxID=94328 RepID=UPI001C4DD435|nr:ATP-dependent Clp protease proteolytic subunit-related protein 3, chloroplastic-like [Zingiber officinale]